ncbi:MAG: hypothetical protein ABSE52_01185 [Candidatus Dormibacteria bacterium]|jgi:uncharacterized membrane protein HdeD (DUF308 family)
MPWVIKRRWWLLAGGVVLLVLGLGLSGPETSLRAILGVPGIFLVFWGALGVLLSIPLALRARHVAPRPPDSN